MATNSISTAQQLANLEETRKEQLTELEEKLKQKKKSLLEKRKEEIFKLFVDNSAFTIDDQLLSGFLRFAMNKDNKDHSTLKEFKEAAASSKPPSKSVKQNTK